MMSIFFFSSIPFRLHIPWFRYKKASRKSRTLLSIDTILNNNKNLRDAQPGLNSKRYDMVACHHHRPIPYIIYDVHKEQTTRYYSRAHNNIKTQFNFRCFAASPHRLRRTRMDPSRTCSTLCDVSHTLLLAKDVPKELHVFRNEAKSKAANVIIIDIKHACWAWYPPPTEENEIHFHFKITTLSLRKKFVPLRDLTSQLRGKRVTRLFLVRVVHSRRPKEKKRKNCVCVECKGRRQQKEKKIGGGGGKRRRRWLAMAVKEEEWHSWICLDGWLHSPLTWYWLRQRIKKDFHKARKKKKRNPWMRLDIRYATCHGYQISIHDHLHLIIFKYNF